VRSARARGPKPSIPDETIAEIVRLTTQTTPEGATHWSVRSMAARVGVSPASVQRIWSQLGLKPHLTETFQVSTDPRPQRASAPSAPGEPTHREVSVRGSA
jgi:hypothetical protein